MTQCMILTLLLAFIACLGFSACQHMRSVSPVEARRQAIDLLAQGQHYETRGEYKLALDLFIQAAELSPRPAVFYHLGHCHSALGQYERAIAYYQKALAMAPDYALAKYELSQAEYQSFLSPPEVQMFPVLRMMYLRTLSRSALLCKGLGRTQETPAYLRL
jgi:tetratricopeptide (TPR) repeat protein